MHIGKRRVLTERFNVALGAIAFLDLIEPLEDVLAIERAGAHFFADVAPNIGAKGLTTGTSEDVEPSDWVEQSSASPR